MRILVTGAAGFLGTYVVRALQARGDWVAGLDNRAVPDIDHLVDITQPDFLDRVEGVLDCVVHLAAIAAPKACEANPLLAFDVNVRGTYNVLKLAVERGATRFVLTSSAHVYGIPPKYLSTDEEAPLQLLDTYTISKQLAERACELAYATHGLPYVSLRLYNGYGPGQPTGYFIPDMIAKARKEGRIELAGHRITKDFLYVDDMVRAIVAATETAYVGPMNIGSGRETSLGWVAERLGRLLVVPVELRDYPPQPEDTRMQCDVRRAQRVLGWGPLVDLEQGLALTVHAAKEA